MGEVIRFISKAERERARLIREARARYEQIFPSEHAEREQRGKEAVGNIVGGANANRRDGGLLP